MTISRYLAKEFNLAGKDSWEEAKADMFVDTCCDLMECKFIPSLTVSDDFNKS